MLVGLRQSGVSIASVSVAKPTLDEVFLALTGHDTGRPARPDPEADESLMEVNEHRAR